MLLTVWLQCITLHAEASVTKTTKTILVKKCVYVFVFTVFGNWSSNFLAWSIFFCYLIERISQQDNKKKI